MHTINLNLLSTPGLKVNSPSREVDIQVKSLTLLVVIDLEATIEIV